MIHSFFYILFLRYWISLLQISYGLEFWKALVMEFVWLVVFDVLNCSFDTLFNILHYRFLSKIHKSITNLNKECTWKHVAVKVLVSSSNRACVFYIKKHYTLFGTLTMFYWHSWRIKDNFLLLLLILFGCGL